MNDTLKTWTEIVKEEVESACEAFESNTGRQVESIIIERVQAGNEPFEYLATVSVMPKGGLE